MWSYSSTKSYSRIWNIPIFKFVLQFTLHVVLLFFLSFFVSSSLFFLGGGGRVSLQSVFSGWRKKRAQKCTEVSVYCFRNFCPISATAGLCWKFTLNLLSIKFQYNSLSYSRIQCVEVDGAVSKTLYSVTIHPKLCLSMLITSQFVVRFNNISFHELHSDTEGQYFPETDYLILPVMNVIIN